MPAALLELEYLQDKYRLSLWEYFALSKYDHQHYYKSQNISVYDSYLKRVINPSSFNAKACRYARKLFSINYSGLFLIFSIILSIQISSACSYIL